MRQVTELYEFLNEENPKISKLRGGWYGYSNDTENDRMFDPIKKLITKHSQYETYKQMYWKPMKRLKQFMSH